MSIVSEAEDPLETSPSPGVVQILVENHRQFLNFLEARVGSRAAAEDVLQAAFVKGLEKVDTVKNEERATAWFYRLLRNALVDHYRRNASRSRTIVEEADEPEKFADEEMARAVCECLDSLIPTLKPEYARILDSIDIKEASLDRVARELGITVNNATVRLHRARQALKRQLERSCGTCANHGCLNCTCGGSSGCKNG